MSAIAEVHIVRRSDLDKLVKVASDPYLYRETLTTVSQGNFVYGYSGWILGTLLPILDEEYDIDLMKSEESVASQLNAATSATHFILTSEDREAYSHRLSSESFDGSVLRKSYEEFNETEAAEAEEFMPDGIRFLKASLDHLTKDSVAILSIG